MKHKMWSRLLSMALAVSVSAMPALAAEGDTSSTEPTTYVVTFRPGEHGRFTDSFIDGLKAYGAVRTSEATGAVAVQLDEGDTLPNAPQLTDIVMNEAASRYFVTDAAQGYTSGTAGGDLDAVAQYTLRASTEDAVFTVQYLDRETGAEVAPTLQGSAPVGQNLTFYALNNIENYTAEVASQQLTISANADENVVTFHYTAGVNNPVGQNLTFYALNNIENYTAEVASQQLTISANADENVVTFHYTAGVNNVTETVTVPGGTGGAGGAGAGGAGAGDGGDTVTIPETETPQAGGDDTPGGEDVEIPDESTPQANLPGENANGSMMPMVLGGAALAIVVIAAIVCRRERKRQHDAHGTGRRGAGHCGDRGNRVGDQPPRER